MKLTLYPEPVLKKRADNIERFSGRLATLVEQMGELMQAEDGLGLAGPQVGLSKRIFIARTIKGEEFGPVRAYINPEIISVSAEMDDGEEGCLSFPRVHGIITRHREVVVRARDVNGELFEERGMGILARCFEHEIDHLDGIVFITRMGAGDLLKNRSALRDLEKAYKKRNKTAKR